jgi:hypothetical protein
MANRIHAIVDRKVAADEVSSHGGILLGQVLGRIVCICLIFAVVHGDDTSISSGRGIGAIVWVRPAAPLAKTCQDLRLVPCSFHEPCFFGGIIVLPPGLNKGSGAIEYNV